MTDGEGVVMSKLLPIGRREFLESGLAALGGTSVLVAGGRAEVTEASGVRAETRQSSAASDPGSGSLPAWCPQPYTVTRDESQGKLILSTPYYTVEHDLKKGGTISSG